LGTELVGGGAHFGDVRAGSGDFGFKAPAGVDGEAEDSLEVEGIEIFEGLASALAIAGTELEGRQALVAGGSQLEFGGAESGGSGEIVGARLEGAGEGIGRRHHGWRRFGEQFIVGGDAGSEEVGKLEFGSDGGMAGLFERLLEVIDLLAGTVGFQAGGDAQAEALFGDGE
jgi:hypothetical protein